MIMINIVIINNCSRDVFELYTICCADQNLHAHTQRGRVGAGLSFMCCHERYQLSLYFTGRVGKEEGTRAVVLAPCRERGTPLCRQKPNPILLWPQPVRFPVFCLSDLSTRHHDNGTSDLMVWWWEIWPATSRYMHKRVPYNSLLPRVLRKHHYTRYSYHNHCFSISLPT